MTRTNRPVPPTQAPPARPEQRSEQCSAECSGDCSGECSNAATAARESGSLVIDCDSCLARGDACGDCVVSCLLGPPPPQGRRLDGEQVQAIDVLSATGLVPPLRLVTSVPVPAEWAAPEYEA